MLLKPIGNHNSTNFEFFFSFTVTSLNVLSPVEALKAKYEFMIKIAA